MVSDRTVVTIQKQLQDKLEIQAEKEHRSLSNLVNKALIEYLDKIED
ncbi:ribbon-helix-helix domain-containing protein [Clostridium sp.]|nr:hypothetical protein [uncultured Clostridium sp.]